MDIQRIRNLTTGILHTRIEHVYEDLEHLTDAKGIMTHMLPNVCRAIEPWLRERITDERFWDGKHDPDHVGDFNLEPMSKAECEAAMNRYLKLPSPLAGKAVIPVVMAVDPDA